MKKSLQTFFNNYNLNVTDDLELQNRWLAWYQGTDAFYSYNFINAERHRVQMTRLSMNALSRVCTDWASLLLNENTLISLGRENNDLTRESKLLQEILDETGFLSQLQQFVERYFAVGTGALVFGRDAAGKVQISYVDGTRCFVIKQNAFEPTKAAFCVDYGDDMTLVSIHENGEVRNFLLDKDGKELNVEDIGLKPLEKYDHKTFVWLKPAIARRGEWTSVYGQSIFAAAIDANKLLDTVFDGYANEFLLGRKRIFVRQDLMTYERGRDDDGNSIVQAVFDPTDAAFNMIPTMGDTDDSGVQDLIKEVDMNLRQADYSNAIQDALNYVSANCFLGSHYYEFSHETGQVTATQVVSANSVLYRNLRKQENQLERALRQAVQIMLAMENVKIELTDVHVKWDDSIIVDEETERENDRQDVRDGVMSKVEFRMKWYGETEEQAAEKIGKVEQVDLAPEF